MINRLKYLIQSMFCQWCWLSSVRLLQSCKGVNLSLLKKCPNQDLCGFSLWLKQTPEASSSRAGDLCWLSHNWTAGAWFFQDRGNAISLLDIDNAFGDGCQHVNSLAPLLSESQADFVTAGSWRLPTTLRLFLWRMSHLPDCSPKLSPQVKANIRQCQPQGLPGHLSWEPAPSSVPSPSTQTGKWAELRLPSTGQHPQYTTKHQHWQCLSSSRGTKTAALHIIREGRASFKYMWHSTCPA